MGFNDWINRMVNAGGSPPPASPIGGGPSPSGPQLPIHPHPGGVPTLLGKPVTDYDPQFIATLIKAKAAQLNNAAPPPGIDYGGGGGGVTANDVMGQGGPITLPPIYAGNPQVQANVDAGRPVQVSGQPPSSGGGLFGAVMQPVADAKARVDAAQAAADAARANAPTSGPSADPWAQSAVGATPGTMSGDQYYQSLVASGGYSPAEAVQLASAYNQSQVDKAKADATRSQVTAAASPGLDPVGSAIGNAASDPVGTAKTAAVDVFQWPQHQVALMEADHAYNAAKARETGGGSANSEMANTAGAFAAGDVINKVYGETAGRVINATSARLNHWAQSHPEQVIDSYEHGFVKKDKDGNIVKQVGPGSEAVLAAFEDDQNFFGNMSFQMASDPWMALPGVGMAGDALKGITVAEDASGMARAAAAGARGVGTVLEGAKALSEIPEKAVVGTIKGANEAARVIPYVGDTVGNVIDATTRYATVPGQKARTMIEQSKIGQALQQIMKTDPNVGAAGTADIGNAAADAGTTATQAGTTADDAGTAATSATDDLGGATTPRPEHTDKGLPVIGKSTGVVPGDVVAQTPDYSIVEDSQTHQFWLLDDAGNKVSGIGYDDFKEAQDEATRFYEQKSASAAPSGPSEAPATVPQEPAAAAPVEPPVTEPVPAETAPVNAATDANAPVNPTAPEAPSATVFPDTVPDWLRPKEGGTRAVDLVPQLSRDEQLNFYSRYNDLASNYAADARSLDDPLAKRAAGTDDLTNRAQKVYAEAKFAKDTGEIFRDATHGQEPPPFVPRFADLGRKQVINEGWLNAVSQHGYDADVRDGIQGVVGLALGKDPAEANQVIFQLEKMNDNRANSLARQLREWRTNLYGDEGAAGAAAIPQAPLGGPLRGGAAPTIDDHLIRIQQTNPEAVGKFYDQWDQVEPAYRAKIADAQSLEDTIAKSIASKETTVVDGVTKPKYTYADQLAARKEGIVAEVEQHLHSGQIFKDATAETPPPFAGMASEHYPNDLVVTDRRWSAKEHPTGTDPKVAMNEWWNKVKTGEAPIEQYDSLVETALGADDLAASQVRTALRVTGDPDAKALAESLKRDRARLYPGTTHADRVGIYDTEGAYGKRLSLLPDSIHDPEIIAERTAGHDAVAAGKKITAVSDPIKVRGKFDLTVTYDDGTTATLPYDTNAGRSGGAAAAKSRLEALIEQPTGDVIPAAAAPSDIVPPTTAAEPAADMVPKNPLEKVSHRATDKYPDRSYFDGPNRGLWNKAADASTREESVAVVDDYATKKYGPRDDAMQPGGRKNRAGNLIPDQSPVYKATTEGRAWKRMDQLKEAIGNEWDNATEMVPRPQPATAAPDLLATGGDPLALKTQTVPPTTPATGHIDVTPPDVGPMNLQAQPRLGETAPPPITQDIRDRISTGGTTPAEPAPPTGGANQGRVPNLRRQWTTREVAFEHPEMTPAQVTAETLRRNEAATADIASTPGRQQLVGQQRMELQDGATPFTTAGGDRGPATSLHAQFTPVDGSDPLSAAFDQGVISQEQHDLLAKEFTVGGKRVKVGGKWTTEGGDQKRVIDIFRGKLLEGKTADEAIAATLHDIRPSITPNEYGKVRKVLAGAYNGVNSFGREHRMYGILKGPVGIAADTFGNAFSAIQVGNWEAAADILRGKYTKQIYKSIREGAPAALEATDTAITVDRLGLIPRSVEGVAVHTEGTTREFVAQKFIRKLTKAVLGDDAATKVGNAVGELFSSTRLRDLREAGDINGRWSIYGTELKKLLPQAREDFFRTLDDRAGSIDTTLLKKQLGDEFAPSDVLRLSKEAGIDKGQAEYLSRSWRTAVSKLDDAAFAEQNRILFDFSASELDEQLKKVFQFHTWQFRAAPFYARNALKNPILMNAYGDVLRNLEADCSKRQGQQCGYLQLGGSIGGQLGFMNPGYLLSSALINMDPQRWSDPNATMLDKVLKFMPASVAPAFQGIISAIGLSDVQDPDWLSFSTDRRAVGGLVNFGRAHGWFGEGMSHSLGADPYAEALGFPRKLTKAAQDWVAQNGGPNMEWLLADPQYLDPKRQDNVAIQAHIRDLIYAENDIPLGTSIDNLERDHPTVADTLHTALDAWQNGTPNEYADQAFKDYTLGNVIAQGAGLAIPGGVVQKTASQMELMGTKNAAQTGNLAQHDEAAGALKIAGLGSSMATDLAFGQAAVDQSGTQAGRNVYDGYNQIVYGDNPGLLTGDLFGLSTPDVLAMTTEQRQALADQWMARTANPTETAGLLSSQKDARAAASAANPADAAYRDWSNTYRDTGPSFRISLTRQSPSYARYMAGYGDYVSYAKSKGFAPMTIDEYGVTRDAYTAANGQRSTAQGPGTGTQVNATAPYPVSATAGATGTGFGSTSGDRVASLTNDLKDYSTRMGLYQNALYQLTGNPNVNIDDVEPMLRDALIAHLAQAGIQQPYLSAEATRYTAWAKFQQSQGGPTDMASYFAMKDKLKAQYGSDIAVNQALDAAIGGQSVPQPLYSGQSSTPFYDTSLGNPIPSGSNAMAGTTLGQ